MPLDIYGGAPTPRVSTPGPYNVPVWDTSDIDTQALDTAYQNYYGAAYAPREAQNYQPIGIVKQGSKPSQGTHLHSLKEWVPLLQYDKEAKLAQQRDAIKDQTTEVYGKALDLAKNKAEQSNWRGTGTYNGGSTVDVAKSYIGQNRYKYGGFDCSKFTQEVAASSGVKIPRDTASQMDFFKKNKMFAGLAQAQPGDIIYLGSKASPSGRHTGVYLGNGKMIDNAGRGVPIDIRSIKGRSVLGVGKLSYLVPQRGDAKGGITKEDYGYKGQTGVPGTKGPAPFGLQTDMFHSLTSMVTDMQKAGLGAPTVNDGYRSLPEQRSLRKLIPQRTVEPGDSVHGLGKAVDLQLTPAQQAFADRYSQRYGLARMTDEPWHFAKIPSGGERL